MYFILTTKSLLWVTLSVFSTITCYSALYGAIQSSRWLVSTSAYNCSSSTHLETIINNNTDSFYDVRCYPSVGIHSQCAIIDYKLQCGSFVNQGLATDPTMFPIPWKIAWVLMSVGIFINFLMAIMAVGSFCKQSICKKSVFGVAGSGQGFAGLLYMIGVIGFAAGWGAKRVMDLCGTQSDPFVSGDCQTGSGLYTAAFGIFLTFASAMLSGPADRATSSDKVALQVEQGENVVFLL